MRVKRDIGGAALLDACYRLDQPDAEWVRSLAESSRPLLDHGFGTMAYGYDLRDPHAARMGPVAVAGGDPSWVAKPMQVLTEYGWDTLTFAYMRTPSVFSGRAVVAARCPPDDWKERLAPGTPVEDFLSLRSSPTSPVGVLVGAPLPHLANPRGRELRALTQLTEHMGAAFRLRDGLRREEAVLRTDGRVEHAEGEARGRSMQEALREAALRIDAARSRSSREERWKAVALWPALVQGRWTLVDRFDRDGRHYLIALRNPAPRTDISALTPREAQAVALAARGMANKLIAHHLGIAPSTAGTLVTRALRKLRAKRTDLPLLAKLALADDEPARDA